MIDCSGRDASTMNTVSRASRTNATRLITAEPQPRAGEIRAPSSSMIGLFAISQATPPEASKPQTMPASREPRRPIVTASATSPDAPPSAPDRPMRSQRPASAAPGGGRKSERAGAGVGAAVGDGEGAGENMV
jgi:hypothetical protein